MITIEDMLNIDLNKVSGSGNDIIIATNKTDAETISNVFKNHDSQKKKKDSK